MIIIAITIIISVLFYHKIFKDDVDSKETVGERVTVIIVLFVLCFCISSVANILIGSSNVHRNNMSAVEINREFIIDIDPDVYDSTYYIDADDKILYIYNDRGVFRYNNVESDFVTIINDSNAKETYVSEITYKHTTKSLLGSVWKPHNTYEIHLPIKEIKIV